MRHNFRGTKETDALVKAGTALTGNRSEFLNRCVLEFGESVIRMIRREKDKAIERELRVAGRGRKAPQGPPRQIPPKGGIDWGIPQSGGKP